MLDPWKRKAGRGSWDKWETKLGRAWRGGCTPDPTSHLMCAHICTYVRTHTHTCMYTHAHTHTCTYTHARTHMHTCMYTHARTCTHTHAHKHAQLSLEDSKLKPEVFPPHPPVLLIEQTRLPASGPRARFPWRTWAPCGHRPGKAPQS